MSIETDKMGILESIKAASKAIESSSRRGPVNGIVLHVSNPLHRLYLKSQGYEEVGNDLWKKK